MGFADQEALYWVVQPLLDAGLPPEEIERLVARLAFDAVVGLGTLDELGDLVDGRPPEVRAAWTQSIARMLSSTGEPAGRRSYD